MATRDYARLSEGSLHRADHRELHEVTAVARDYAEALVWAVLAVAAAIDPRAGEQP